MKPSSPHRHPPPETRELMPGVFAGVLGAFFGLCLLKFGNPPIFENWVTPPANIYEFLFNFPWPITWAYRLLGLAAVMGLIIARPKPVAPSWLVALPAAWFLWQIVAGTQSVAARLTTATLKHLLACVICFYLGFFSLSRVKRLWPFWLGLGGGFLGVLAVGWEQHFGGLKETQQYFYTYVSPTMNNVPPEFLKKMSSSRIFSTLFYPNTLAGALLLLLPVSLAAVLRMRALLTISARLFLVAVIAVAALGCLYWSGSKGGWLLMLLLGLIALLRLPFGRRLKLAIATVILVGGMAGFFLKYAGFFEKGATSVSARFDYWKAAVQTARSHPLCGTGPGTFAIPYEDLRPPGAEPTRLVHNDYLEQASDSGFPGFGLYALFVVGTIISTFPAGDDWLAFSLWLGVLGWSLQSLMEFGLYIPALAWPAFAFMGWLLATRQNPAKNER